MLWILRKLLRQPELTLVTASDASHARSLMNFLASAGKHEGGTRLIVYDLGLTSGERADIEAHIQCEVRSFDYSKYPAYFDIRDNAGEYAWKPTVIREVVRESNGIVCWMDAGNVITTTLTKLRREARRTGHYSPRAAGTVGQWTHPGMLSYLGLPPSWADNLPSLNGACVAFDTRNVEAVRLVNEWADLALVKDCIAPEGSSRANHRQDQSLFSLLAYRAGRPPTAENAYLGFKIHQDVETRPTG